MKLRTLKAGEKITVPGAYRLSMAAYHGQPCDGPSISHSGLKTIFHESAAHYWRTAVGLNPDAGAFEETPYVRRGRVAHHLLLGESSFDAVFSVRPEKWGDWRTDAAKRWKALEILDGKTVLEPSVIEDVRGMAEALSKHPLVQAGALNGDIEVSLFWKDEETGIWLKSRPDAIPTDGGDFVDLKVTSSVEYSDLQKAIATYGYNQQGALIGEASRRVLRTEMQSFTLFFVEGSDPYSVRPVQLKDADIEMGARQNRAALRLFAQCVKTNLWPGPGGTQSDAEWIEMPPWAKDRIEDRIAMIERELFL